MSEKILVYMTNDKQIDMFEEFIKKSGAIIANGTEAELMHFEDYHCSLADAYLLSELSERLTSVSSSVKELWGKDLEARQTNIFDQGYHIESLKYYCDGKIVSEVDYEEEVEFLENSGVEQTEGWLYSSMFFKKTSNHRFKI